MKCALYLRISDDQTGKQAGVDRQRESCEDLARRLGWDVVEVFTDNDISAYSGKRRPGFEDLLAAIENKRVDALVCWHTDRLYRRVKDLVRLLDASSTLRIQTVEGGDIDLSNANGRMMATILGSVSTNESEHHAERRRAANLARAVSGEWRKEGSRPFGFNNDGTHREPEASMIRQAVTDILSGKSLHAVAREWNETGVLTVRGVPWTNLHVRRVLTNARIAALRVHQKKVIGPGNWKPIIDETSLHGLVAFLSNPDRRNSVAFERRYLLSGVAQCGVCDRPLYAAHPHGPNRAMLYVCKSGSHVGRKGVDLDELVERTVLAYLLREDVGSDLRRTEDGTDRDELRTQREALIETKDQLATLLRKGILDVVGVEREAAVLTGEIASVDRQLAKSIAFHPLVAILADHGENLSDLDAAKLVERWNQATPDRKGKAIKALMTVKVNPTGRGERIFNPDTVNIEWIDYGTKVLA